MERLVISQEALSMGLVYITPNLKAASCHRDNVCLLLKG